MVVIRRELENRIIETYSQFAATAAGTLAVTTAALLAFRKLIDGDTAGAFRDGAIKSWFN
jgi:hypothetical protein